MARKYALLVATSKFDDDRLKKLHAPDDDVTQLREILKDKSFAGFDEVGLCLNSSIGVVQDAVADLFAGKADDDLVLFYYSGHGLTDPRGRLYFALPDTNIERPSAQSLGASFVRQHMDDSGSTRQILMLDCCHSGAFMSDGKLVARNAENAVLKRSTFDPKGHGRFVLSASAASESSFERDGKSIYTQTLVDGLRSGDIAPEKKVITVTDVHNYLSREVKGKKAPQQPQFWADGQTAPLIISKNPNVIKPIDQDVIDALTGDSWLAQKGAISELEQIVKNGPPKLREEALKLLQARVDDPEETNRVAKAARTVIQRSAQVESPIAPLTGVPSSTEQNAISEEGVATENRTTGPAKSTGSDGHPPQEPPVSKDFDRTDWQKRLNDQQFDKYAIEGPISFLRPAILAAIVWSVVYFINLIIFSGDYDVMGIGMLISAGVTLAFPVWLEMRIRGGTFPNRRTGSVLFIIGVVVCFFAAALLYQLLDELDVLGIGDEGAALIACIGFGLAGGLSLAHLYDSKFRKTVSLFGLGFSAAVAIISFIGVLMFDITYEVERVHYPEFYFFVGFQIMAVFMLFYVNFKTILRMKSGPSTKQN